MLAFMKTRRRDQHVWWLGSLASHLAAVEEDSGAVSTSIDAFMKTPSVLEGVLDSNT